MFEGWISLFKSQDDRQEILSLIVKDKIDNVKIKVYTYHNLQNSIEKRTYLNL